MSTFKDAIPASLRRPALVSRFAQELVKRSSRPTAMNHVAALTKNRFSRLPHEPEDAKLTGVTRSLNRRLLALNVNGSIARQTMIPAKSV